MNQDSKGAPSATPRPRKIYVRPALAKSVALGAITALVKNSER